MMANTAREHRRLDRTLIHWTTEPRCHLILLANWVEGRLNDDQRCSNLFNQLKRFRRCWFKLGPFCRFSFPCFIKNDPKISHLNKKELYVSATTSGFFFFPMNQQLTLPTLPLLLCKTNIHSLASLIIYFTFFTKSRTGKFQTSLGFSINTVRNGPSFSVPFSAR